MEAAIVERIHASRVTRNEALMGLGIAILGWLVCAGLLAMFAPATPAGVPQNDAAGKLAHFIVPLLAGLLCQSSVSALSSVSRLRHAAALWLGWTVLGLAAAIVARELDVYVPWSVVDSLVQQAGIVLGIALGWLGAQGLTRALEGLLAPLETLTRAVIAALSFAIVLAPVSLEAALLDPASGWHISSAGAYLRAVPNQIYLALKSLILWVPLGMLYALAQKQVQLRHWAIAALLGFLIVGLPLLHDTLKVQDAMEILSAYWGICAGIQLGMAVYRTSQAHASEAHAAPLIAAPGASAGLVALRIAAALLLLGVAAWSWFFPRWGLELVCGLVLYALLLWRYRHAWLLVVPAALPLLNLAPGTGRFYFDEFDLLIVTTLAMALWHGAVPPPRATLSRPIGISLVLFGISVMVSLVIGLLPLSPLDANAFASYWSHYNSLRVAKGFLWALALLALVRWTLPADVGLGMRLFVPGMWLGLAAVIVAGLWERWLFAGLSDFRVPYRITATFSSMHTGGSEIETYLVIAIPFVWLAFAKERPALVRLGAIALLILGAFLMTLTIARAGVLALGVALCILVLGAWRMRQPREGTAILGAIALLGGAGALAFGLTGDYLQKRLAHSAEDWAVRATHWQKTLAIRDPDWAATLFGMGLGRFPETYLFRSGAASLPATYRFVEENGERFLRLGSGETSYMAQRVPATGGARYTLSLRLRTSDANTRLHVPLCERHLLDSFRCRWQAVSPPADGRWRSFAIAIDSGAVGAGSSLTRRPVELTLYNETEGTRVDVDDVQLQDEAGRKLIQNGDFSAGADYWFFKTHSHLPWHIKNLWVEVLFEQGWFGLSSFLLLIATVASALARAVWRGNAQAAVLLAAIGGFLTVGMFGSLFDTPRIAMLFYLLTVLAGTVRGASDFFTVPAIAKA
jgi:hypothetical protein